MPTIRELTALLGFKVDTAPATRFDAQIDRSKKKLEGLSKVRLGSFGKRLKTMFSVAAGGVVAVGAASLVAFKKFSDVERGLKQLEFQFKSSFKPLKEEIDSILSDKTLGKLTTELELVNTAAAAFELGLDPDVFIRSLRPALEFAIVNRKNVSEITAAISAFIGTGDLDLLIKMGNLNQRQIELLKTAGVGPGQAGIIARTAKVEELFAGIRPDIQKRLQELIESGVLSQEQFLNTLNETTKELGEKTLPAMKAISKAAIDLLDEFRKRIKEEDEGVIEAFFKTLIALPKGFEPFSALPESQDFDITGVKIDESLNLGNIIKKIFGKKPELTESEFLAQQKFLKERRINTRDAIANFFKDFAKSLSETRVSGGFSGFVPVNRTTNQTTNANTSSQNINVTVPITIQSGANADPAAIEQAVQVGIRRAMGAVAEQSRATTTRRGGG